MQSVREIMQTLRASPVFALAVLLTLGLAGLNSLMVGLMNLAPGALPGGFARMAHFTGLDHRVHDLTAGFLFIPAVIGMLAQLRRPARNVAGQVMSIIPVAGLVLTMMLTVVLTSNTYGLQPPWIMVGAAALIATILHPAWRDFFRSFSVAQVNRVMLGLVIVAAVPLLAFALTNIRRQGTVNDDHAALGHYGFMAAFAFTVIGVGLLASLRPDGWRVTAWVAGLLPALLGVAALVYPDVSSSLGPAWALAAIAWGFGFVAAAELMPRADSAPSPAAGTDPGPEPGRGSPLGPPRWVQGVAGISLVLVVLYVGLLFTGISRGGGPGGQPAGVTAPGEASGHTPPIQHGP